MLPHLSAVCQTALKESGAKSVEVAAAVGRAQNTVDRFLKAQTYPRAGDLDEMVNAVAHAALRDPGELWQEAVSDAIETERDARRAAGKSKAQELGDARRKARRRK